MYAAEFASTGNVSIWVFQILSLGKMGHPETVGVAAPAPTGIADIVTNNVTEHNKANRALGTGRFLLINSPSIGLQRLKESMNCDEQVLRQADNADFARQNALPDENKCMGLTSEVQWGGDSRGSRVTGHGSKVGGCMLLSVGQGIMGLQGKEKTLNRVDGVDRMDGV